MLSKTAITKELHAGVREGNDRLSNVILKVRVVILHFKRVDYFTKAAQSKSSHNYYNVSTYIMRFMVLIIIILLYLLYTIHGIYDYNSTLVKYVNSVYVCTVDQNDHSLLTTNAQVVLSLMQAELVKTDTSWSPLYSSLEVLK